MNRRQKIIGTVLWMGLAIIQLFCLGFFALVIYVLCYDYTPTSRENAGIITLVTMLVIISILQSLLLRRKKKKIT